MKKIALLILLVAPLCFAKEDAKAQMEKKVTGVITLKKGIGYEPNPKDALFVILRPVGQEGGPPYAVNRILRPKFPQKFEVGTNHTMIVGRKAEGPFNVSVRLSQKQTVMKRDGDFISTKPVVAKWGDTKVTLALDGRLQLTPKEKKKQ